MPVYGAKTQYAKQDEIPPLTAKQCLNIQKHTGSVLYVARALDPTDPTVFVPLNDTEQKKATQKHRRKLSKCYITWQLIQTPPSDIMHQI
jgi:hypothetical protein